jgi:predicted protein tyrosine phosphatase
MDITYQPPPFELKICGIFEAQLWTQNGWPTHVVSMVDPGVNVPFTCANHLILHLHDVESQMVDEWVLGSEEHVDAILDFTRDLADGDRLLVHCHQGLSRSTSASLGIMLQHGMDAEAAYRHVESIRDILLPNSLISRIIDDRFNLGGELTDIVMRERREKMQRRMTRSIDATDHSSVMAMKDLLVRLDLPKTGS